MSATLKATGIRTSSRTGPLPLPVGEPEKTPSSPGNIVPKKQEFPSSPMGAAFSIMRRKGHGDLPWASGETP